MPLEPVPELIAYARKHGYALGYFESWSLESLQGVIDAAEATRSPVIIGFNGEFLSRPERIAEERLALYGSLGRAAASSARVPCGFVFNECSRDDWLERAIAAGFNLVMPADPTASYEEYEQRVQALAGKAHAAGVAIEAELGELPSGASGAVVGGSAPTDPEVAGRFVQATGVDLLAVSIGNIHVKIGCRLSLNLDRLRSIARYVSVPLVLHGGTGIADESLRRAIALGVAKVNYGTILKQRYLTALRHALTGNHSDPHELVGMGGSADILVAGRCAVRDAVTERMAVLGCTGGA